MISYSKGGKLLDVQFAFMTFKQNALCAQRWWIIMKINFYHNYITIGVFSILISR